MTNTNVCLGNVASKITVKTFRIALEFKKNTNLELPCFT